jgi:hypothetical protein
VKVAPELEGAGALLAAVVLVVLVVVVVAALCDPPPQLVSSSAAATTKTAPRRCIRAMVEVLVGAISSAPPNR